MQHAVDEERGGPLRAAGPRALDVVLDPSPQPVAIVEVRGQAPGVEPHAGRVRAERVDVELVLVGEEHVVQLPEAALARRRLGEPRGGERVRVQVGQRQLAPDEPHAVAERGLDAPHVPVGQPGVRALVVPEDQELGHVLAAAAPVVALEVGRGREPRGVHGSGSSQRMGEVQNGLKVRYTDQ